MREALANNYAIKMSSCLREFHKFVSRQDAPTEAEKASTRKEVFARFINYTFSSFRLFLAFLLYLMTLNFDLLIVSLTPLK